MTGKYQTETPLATNGSASPGASLAPPIINKEPTADHDAEVVALTPSSSGFLLHRRRTRPPGVDSSG